MIGVYFESWACPWTDKAEDCALAKIDKPVDIVFLSFVRPDCTYKKSQGTWSGTGLDFSPDFQVIRKAIQILKSKGIKVLLAVGGASYGFDVFHHKSVAELMYDLELDGMDIDWEPVKGIADAAKFGPILEQAKQYCVSGQLLSAAVFGYGALSPREGDLYRGINLQGLMSHGHLLDLINIMAYDGGKEFNVIESYTSFQQFQKKILLGFQVGKQGWGDAYLSLEEVTRVCNYIAPFGDGCFVWAYFKDGDPNCKQVVELARTLLVKKKDSFDCPHCLNPIFISK
jgi:chitinase